MKATIILAIVFAIYISEASSGWKQVLIDVEKSRETVENGRRYANAEPQTGYSSCKEDNILYDGPDIGEKPKLYADMETCHKYCGAIPKCEVWVLYKKGKVCILKSLADRLEKKNNGEFVSGLKDCPKASTTVRAPTTVSAPLATSALAAVSAPTTVSVPAPAAVQAPKTVSAPAAVPEPEAVPAPTTVPALLNETSTTPQHEDGYAGVKILKRYDDIELQYYADAEYDKERKFRSKKRKKYGKCKKGKKCKKCKKGKKCRGGKKKKKKGKRG